MRPLDQARTHELLSALSEQLALRGSRVELVVIGGSALLAVGLTVRTTRDVDVVALRSGDTLVRPQPFPDALVDARDRVARDFDLPEGWLTRVRWTCSTSAFPLGFSRGWNVASTATRWSCISQAGSTRIHFKLYAMADQTAGKHESDLVALEPTRDELIVAARWTRTHDPSKGSASSSSRLSRIWELRMSIWTLRTTVRDGLAAFAWDKWRSSASSLQCSERPDRRAMDPEAFYSVHVRGRPERSVAFR